MTDVTKSTDTPESKPAPKPKPGTTAGANDGLYDHLIGAQTEVQPGDECWILLDPGGVPISIQKDPPAFGVPAAKGRVQATQGEVYQGLVSITGAELGETVNPHPELRFEPSSPEAYAESSKAWSKQEEKRHVRNAPGTNFGESPQLAGAYEDRATHSQNRGQVEGAVILKKADEPKQGEQAKTHTPTPSTPPKK